MISFRPGLWLFSVSASSTGQLLGAHPGALWSIACELGFRCLAIPAQTTIQGRYHARALRGKVVGLQRTNLINIRRFKTKATLVQMTRGTV